MGVIFVRPTERIMPQSEPIEPEEEPAVQEEGITMHEIREIVQMLRELGVLRTGQTEHVARAPPPPPPPPPPKVEERVEPAGGGEMMGLPDGVSIGKIRRIVKVARVLFGDLRLSELEKKLEEMEKELKE